MSVFSMRLSKHVLDVHYIFGLVILHYWFEVPECFEGYLKYSWIIQLHGHSLSLLPEVLGKLF